MEVVFNAVEASTTTLDFTSVVHVLQIARAALQTRFAPRAAVDSKRLPPVRLAFNAQETPISMQALKLAKPAMPRVKPAQEQEHLRAQLAQPRQTFTRERV